MRIALKVTIDMTPEQVAAYCDLAGIDRRDLRADVVRYVENHIQCSADLNVEDGSTTSITVT